MRTKWIDIVSHLAAWLFFFSLVISFFTNGPGGGMDIRRTFSAPFLVFYAVFIFVFYFNMGVLIPQLYLKKRYLPYFFIVLLLFAAVYYIRPFDGLMALNRPPEEGAFLHGPEEGNHGPQRPRNVRGTDITTIVLFISAWSLSTALCVIRQWRRTEKRVLQAEAERATAELSFLKAQVNPHFLFNTLNNIYSLAITGNANTGPSILHLSNIMRYITDEAGKDFVPLEREVACIRDYIELQKMRLNEKMTVAFTTEGTAMDIPIAPLILMTFVENAFKYGISGHESSAITIRLSTAEGRVHFFCQNKILGTGSESDRTGIGISNTRERLLHLYPGKHDLGISSDNGSFTVQLTIRS